MPILERVRAIRPERVAELVQARPILPGHVFVIVYIFLLTCLPSQLIFAPLGAPGTPSNIWAIGGLVWWGLATISGRNPVRGWTTLRITVGLFAAAVLASYILATAHGWYAPADVHQNTDEFWTLLPISQQDMSDKMVSAAGRGLIYMAAWVGVALMVGEGVRDRVKLELVITWLCRFGAFVATLGIIQFYTGVDIAGLYQIPGLTANSDFGAVAARSDLHRISSTAIHPIEFGVLMAGILILSLHRSILLGRASAWIPTGLIAFALPMSVSRSGILVLGVSAAIAWLFWPKSWRLVSLAAAPVFVVAVRLLAPGLVGTIISFFVSVDDDPSVAGRLSDYAMGMQLFSQHPVFGQGLFTLVPRYFRTFDNQLLVLVIEIGVVGIVAFLLMIVGALLECTKAWSVLVDAQDRFLALAVASSLLGVVLSFATFDAFGFSMVAGLTFLLIGLAGALGNLARLARVPVGSRDAR